MERDEELAALQGAFDRVATGPRELVLVVGEAGVGKSSLVMALRDRIAGPGAGPAAEVSGRFIAGKFDRRATNVPFASLIEALRGLVSELMEEPEERRVASKARILHAIGDNGRVLTELLPELEGLIGITPGLAPLEPFEAETRLHVTLQAFVQALASPGRPLVIFLDDLHRADAASLDALHALATDPDGKHVLLVGAFRPREVGAGHPLAKFEAELRRNRMPVSRIDLAPLSETAVKDLLCDALGSPPDAGRRPRRAPDAEDGRQPVLSAASHRHAAQGRAPGLQSPRAKVELAHRADRARRHHRERRRAAPRGHPPAARKRPAICFPSRPAWATTCL